MMVGIPSLPFTAPFTPAQQAWLNGFLAGVLGARDVAAGTGEALSTPSALSDDRPWRDPGLSLERRLDLAEGAPLPGRLMAAMAQLDCGQCGYLCRSYADAIAAGTEKSLTRCVPGGKETARALRDLLAGDSFSPPSSIVVPVFSPATSTHPALFDGAARLNRAGSEKDTRHVVLRLDMNLDFKTGDSLGIQPLNDPELVDIVIEQLYGSPEMEVDCPDGTRRTLREALLRVCDIGRPSDQAIEVLASRATEREESHWLQALAEGYPGAEPVDADLLDLLLRFPSARPPIQELILALSVLQPRLYSIASSPKAHAREVHLTVAAVRYRRHNRLRKGIASTFLAERASKETSIPVFIKASHAFGLPADPETPTIMIGPGTGIAPFRAFLQERKAIGARGRNWLFFGDQRRTCDFLYEEELTALHDDGLLTNFDLAFSRDQADKIYVQHHMRERGAELWRWLEEGAHLYVCGDAQRMARDVDTALTHIVSRQGGMSFAAAKSYVGALALDGRYQRDVY